MPDTNNSVKTANPLSLDTQLCFALYSAQLAMGKVYRNFLKQLGLTYSQYLVMLLLWEKDAVSVNFLGEHLFLDSATLTPLLKRLEAMGLLIKERAQDDQRQVILSLTATGKQLKDKALSIPEAVMCSTGCSPTEAKKLKHDLEALRTNLLSNLR